MANAILTYAKVESKKCCDISKHSIESGIPNGIFNIRFEGDTYFSFVTSGDLTGYTKEDINNKILMALIGLKIEF